MYFKLFIFLTYFISTIICLRAPEIKVSDAVLRGKYRKTWKGREFNAYTGIPYAKPPIGKLRFQPPIASESWNGILDATKYSPPCPQINIFEHDFTVYGNEDCLYLNIYTPQLFRKLIHYFLEKEIAIIGDGHEWINYILIKNNDSASLLPVMIYIHGGGFRSDSANDDLYGPDLLLDKDIILVTFNYRLSFLGFSSTGDHVLPGNNGLKDQNLALKWVKANVAYFGGDSEKITIFGQSAGGASVQLHVVSPLSKNLFHRAIAHSGVATSSWAVDRHENTKANTFKMGEFLNCPTHSSQELIDCFRTFDASKLVEAEKKFMKWDKYPIMLFTPIVEADIEGSFLPEHPIDVIKSGKAANVPIMTGFTTEDGAILSAALYHKNDLIVHLDKNFDSILPMLLQYNQELVDKDFTKKQRQVYFDNGKIDNNTKMELTNLFSDVLFIAPANLAVQLHSKYSLEPVFFYSFGYRGTESYSKIFGDPDYDYGVCHTDDLLYLLSCKLCQDFKPYQHRNMIETMLTLWTNFATMGNPTPVLDSMIPEKWEPATPNSLKYFSITSHNNNKMSDNKYIEQSELLVDFITSFSSKIIKDEL